MTAYRGRFAPSPTGVLHFGSLVAAVGSWLRARSCNGAWLVRMEDLDVAREVPGAATGIIATLGAFGMHSDEPVLFQSTRSDAYSHALERLRASGAAFACQCSRSDLTGRLHRGACVAPRDNGRACAWRLRAPDQVIDFHDAVFGAQAQNLRDAAGDFVLRRIEGWHAYQLAVVVDDAAQGITEVVRGQDLLDSTPRQVYLQRLLGLPQPDYLHLPLALDREGRKLAKRDRDHPLDADAPLPALHAALRLLGQPLPAARDPQRLLSLAAARFDLAALQTAARARPCTIFAQEE